MLRDRGWDHMEFSINDLVTLAIVGKVEIVLVGKFFVNRERVASHR
jgi:hypothetical protein